MTGLSERFIVDVLDRRGEVAGRVMPVLFTAGGRLAVRISSRRMDLEDDVADLMHNAGSVPIADPIEVTDPCCILALALHDESTGEHCTNSKQAHAIIRSRFFRFKIGQRRTLDNGDAGKVSLPGDMPHESGIQVAGKYTLNHLFPPFFSGVRTRCQQGVITAAGVCISLGVPGRKNKAILHGVYSEVSVWPAEEHNVEVKSVCIGVGRLVYIFGIVPAAFDSIIPLFLFELFLVSGIGFEVTETFGKTDSDTSLMAAGPVRLPGRWWSHPFPIGYRIKIQRGQTFPAISRIHQSEPLGVVSFLSFGNHMSIVSSKIMVNKYVWEILEPVYLLIDETA